MGNIMRKQSWIYRDFKELSLQVVKLQSESTVKTLAFELHM